MTKRKETTVLGIVILMIAAGLLYTLLGSGIGIATSCVDKKIIGFQKTPPPLLAVVQEKYCDIEVMASVNGTTICSGKMGVFTFEKGVFPCNELKNNINKTISINVVFFNNTGQSIGSDFKELIYLPQK